MLLDEFIRYLRPSKFRPKKGKWGGLEYRAHCPSAAHANGDKHPSLDVTTNANGDILLVCHSQHCSAEEICRSVGLPLTALFADEGKRERRDGKPYKPRQIPLRTCFETFSLVGWTIHLYGRDRLSGAPFNETTFWQRMADLEAIAKVIDYRDWGQSITELQTLAKHIPKNWSEDLAQAYLKNYIQLIGNIPK